MFKKHILISEIGWQKIRELSISLAAQKTPSTVLIKGLPDKDIRQMITKHDGITNIFISKKFFTLYVCTYIFLNMFVKKKLSLFAETKEKTYTRLSNLEKMFSGIELNR